MLRPTRTAACGKLCSRPSGSSENQIKNNNNNIKKKLLAILSHSSKKKVRKIKGSQLRNLS